MMVRGISGWSGSVGMTRVLVGRVGSTRSVVGGGSRMLGKEFKKTVIKQLESIPDDSEVISFESECGEFFKSNGLAIHPIDMCTVVDKKFVEGFRYMVEKSAVRSSEKVIDEFKAVQIYINSEG
jgi:hypothetical protein